MAIVRIMRIITQGSRTQSILLLASPHLRFLQRPSIRLHADAVDVGIMPGVSKADQIHAKNSNIDFEGIWTRLPIGVRESLQDPSKCKFVSWLGHGVPKGKAAIVQLVTAQEADAIIKCIHTDESLPGVLNAERTSELYRGRVNTTRHLIADQTLASCFFRRLRCCESPPVESPTKSFLSLMEYGSDVVAVNEKIRLVTTAHDGEHQKHADISEPSDDGLRVSRLTFQCYLNPEAYEGGQFQLYPQDGDVPVDVPVGKGCAVVFVQEDAEVMHGGAKKGAGEAKRAIRGNLDVLV